MFLAVDGSATGLIAVADPIKDGAAAAIKALHATGLRMVMATGDSRTTADAVARQLGIDEVHGEVRPQGQGRHWWPAAESGRSSRRHGGRRHQ